MSQQQAQDRLNEVELSGGDAGQAVIQEAIALAAAAQKAENLFSTVSDSPVNQSVADSAARLQRQADVVKSPNPADWNKSPIYDENDDAATRDLVGLSDDTKPRAGDNDLLPFELRPTVESETVLLPSVSLPLPSHTVADDLLTPHGVPKSDITEAKEQILSGFYHEKETNKRDYGQALEKAEHGMGIVAGDLEKGVEDTKENLYEGKENLKQQLYSVSQTVGQAYDEAKQQVSEGVDDVKRDVFDTYESVKQSLSNASTTVAEYYVEAKQQVSEGVDDVIRQAKEGMDEVKQTFVSDDEMLAREGHATTSTEAPETKYTYVQTTVVEASPSGPGFPLTRPRGLSIDKMRESISVKVDEIGESISGTVDEISVGLSETVDSIGETLTHLKEEIVGAFHSEEDDETPLLLDRQPLDNATIAEEKKLINVEFAPPLLTVDEQTSKRVLQDQ